MDPVLAELLTSIGLEAIKIIGPAAIAAFAAYKAASLQFKATLAQLREANEFSARQHLFDYYKERQKRLLESHNELTTSLGQVLGVNAALREDDPDFSVQKMVDTFDSIARLYLGAAPFEISLTVRDMKAKGLDDLEEYFELSSTKQALEGLELGPDFDSKRNVVIALLGVYGQLERCNQLLLEKEMDSLFSKYVSRA